MTTTILLYSIVSFVFIYILHSLYIFFKDTLTTPQVKDLIHKPQTTYMELYNEIHNPSSSQKKETFIQSPSSSPSIQQQNSMPEKETMKNNLKHYLKSIRSQQLQQTNGFETVNHNEVSGMSMEHAYTNNNSSTQQSQNLGFFSPNGDVPLSMQSQDMSNELGQYDTGNFSSF